MTSGNTQATRFLEWINRNYDEQKAKLKAFCNDKHYTWNEDIFCDTYLKIYDKILKTPLKDDSDKGFDGYMFMSFKQNLQREKQYARNCKRDSNVTDIDAANEDFANKNKLTTNDKLLNDLYKDFATLYLIMQVENNFDTEHFYLFKLKTFTNLTYAQLAKKTNMKGVRQKVVAVKTWLKEHITKEEIKKAFELEYGDLFL